MRYNILMLFPSKLHSFPGIKKASQGRLNEFKWLNDQTFESRQKKSFTCISVTYFFDPSFS